MITITIVRHGESTDNLRPVWAGWADAPLSNHGMNQAKAVGASFADIPIDAVFASPLKRAHWTGQQIQLQNKSDPPLTVSPLLREQGFGVAEGHFFAGDDVKYVRHPGRTFKFPEGENLGDVRNRANEAIRLFVEDALRESYGATPDSKHLVFVAHGIFNYEFLSAFLTRRPEGIDSHWAYKGMTNTGWTRLHVGYAGEATGQPLDYDNLPGLPPLTVEILATDVTTHLEGVERQGGGIGSSGFDEKQQEIRAFFSGAHAAE
ncbi:phosphoglycerate mutase-like protein [Cutaneotrichosporon oleaginosum]|uniref:Phosphoglycerate mutase-like protein n=1 Tax=Cutaneotrichosporon oleaginosum TaxID=879819 RepID=A0A0J0XP06_9TREE|nr:phosphoglycerate mutase-like protein [Cutaneotrichosporon oleaginosum]KLT42830.1 phosphoglycerate mutase-like protein [Cutaneotrichosporon oleaginosum]